MMNGVVFPSILRIALRSNKTTWLLRESNQRKKQPRDTRQLSSPVKQLVQLKEDLAILVNSSPIHNLNANAREFEIDR